MSQQTVKLGVTKVGYEAKPLKYSEKNKSCISYQFRADVQTYGHQTRYTADDKAAETDVCSPHLNSFSYLLQHAWRVVSFEG